MDDSNANAGKWDSKLITGMMKELHRKIQTVFNIRSDEKCPVKEEGNFLVWLEEISNKQFIVGMFPRENLVAMFYM